MPRLLVLVLLCAALTHAADWPGWRGPGGQGHSSEKDLPLKWSTTENIRWKVKLPDTGTSTPVIVGSRVFLTQAGDKTLWPPKGGNGGIAAAKTRSLMCFDRKDGRLMWRKDVEYADEEPTHPTNPFCAASPACDGERVVVSHGSAGVYCYDLTGKDLWKVDVGKLHHVWGNASSPVIHRDRVLMWCGPGERQFLLALDKTTGKELWRHTESGGASGLGGKGTWTGSWSTPLVVTHAEREQIILTVPKKVKGLDPKDGTELWSCDGLGALVYSSPLYADGVVVAMSGFHGPALAVKLGGSGDITKDRLWHHTKGLPQRIGSGTIVGKHIFQFEESGAPRCFELLTGEEVWGKQVTKRPGGGAWGSLVAAGGRLYIVGRGGETMIFNADPAKYELLGVNRLGEHTDASMAVSEGELFVRTYRHLWCISTKK